MLRFHRLLPAFAHAVVLASVVETFARRSAVRWWAVGIAAIFLAVAAACWRRTSWLTRTIAPALLLTGMLAVTAWLPGGVDNGLRLLGLSTSTLLTLAAAAGVTLGAFVLWRARPFPIVVRAVVALLAAYGVIAFLSGLAAGVPLTALLSGSSFWRPLPFLFQGAVVGGLIVLPVAMVVAVVRAGLRRPGDGTPLRALQEATALGATFAIVIAGLLHSSAGAQARAIATVASSEQTAGSADANATLPATRVAQMDSSLRALEEADRGLARDRWDIASLVETVGREPDALFTWVRDNTYWLPYRGVLRGALGVLLERQGNSLDRALLLAALLDKAGHTVRLAHGQLTPEQASAILPIVTPPPREASPLQTVRAANLDLVRPVYGVHAPIVEPTLRAQADAMTRVAADLDARVADQSARLLAALNDHARIAANRAIASEADALKQVQDHWWVQVQQGGAWRDLDVLDLRDPSTALTPAVTTPSPADVPVALRHRVAIRLITERVSDGAVVEQCALEHVVDAADVIATPIALQLWPADWPREFPASPQVAQDRFRSLALEQRRWVAVLSIGSAIATQTVLDESGGSKPPGGNPFGGLGSAMSEAVGSQQAARTNQLVAVWLEYELRMPEAPARVVRRDVFDVLPPAARDVRPIRLELTDAQRLTRSLALMQRTDILISSSQLSPEFVAHRATETLLQNHGLMRTLVAGESPIESTEMTQLLDRAAPPVSPLYTLALARFEWSPSGDRAYLDRPNVLTRHRFPIVTADGVALRDATDIVANEIALDGSVPDPFALRVQQGVFDSNAESLLQADGVRLGSAADAFAASHDWVTITPSDTEALGGLDLPEDAKRRLKDDVQAGNVVVAPRRPVLVNGSQFVGWWRIDPRTGDTLGVASTGWGQSMAERAAEIHPLLGFAHTFVLEYAFCQAVPQVLNQALPFFQRHRDVLPWVAWLGPIEAQQSASEVYQSKRRECLLSAMIETGITATLPMILTLIRYKQAERIARSGCFLAGTILMTASGPMAIEHVAVGDAVRSLTTSIMNPAMREAAQSSEHAQPAQGRWRVAMLVVRRADGTNVRARIARPLSWFETTGARVGGTIDLRADEDDVEGVARVVAIGSWPGARSAPTLGAETVTGTIRHENAVVWDLVFDDDPQSAIGVTPDHPIFSADRQAWVPAGMLRIGEHVRALSGSATLTHKSRRAGRYTVYNIEVDRGHTYYVSARGILAHNTGLWSCGRPGKPSANAWEHWDKHGKQFPEYQNAIEYVQGAHNFFRYRPPGTLVYIRHGGPDPGVLLYHPPSNTFGSYLFDGTPRTMFRPLTRMFYWLDQLHLD